MLITKGAETPPGGMSLNSISLLVFGFFGLGAGWAIVPVLNLVMAAPLKVAAACSGILIGMGDCISVWPYIFAGAIIPLFAALWLVGQVVGGIVGVQVLIRIKSGSIRLLLVRGPRSWRPHWHFCEKNRFRSVGRWSLR